jgi:hypothetical protein
MYNLVEAVFSMRLDVYRQLDTQDPDTGAIKKEWAYYKTVPCHAKGIISNSATARSGDRQVFDNRYRNEQVIEVRTSKRLTAREKVTNICNSEGTLVWAEIDFPTETPTVFEVVGTTPITDPFGKVLGYNTIMKRSENQIIGL